MNKPGKRQVAVLGYLLDEQARTCRDIVAGTGLTPNQVQGAIRGLLERHLIKVVGERGAEGRELALASGGALAHRLAMERVK